MAITGSAASATVQSASVDPIAGLVVTAVAADATDGHKFVNDGNTRLTVINGGGGSILLTIQTNKQIKGYDIAEFTETLLTGETRVYKKFDPAIFNDSNGVVLFGFDVATSVTFHVVK